MHYRKAVLADLPAVSRIISDAVRFMLDSGRCQWDETYPRDEHLFDDITGGVGRVLEDEDGRVMAYGAVVTAGEPAYEGIEGEWLTDGDYVVVHRMAVDEAMKGRGIGRKFLSAVEHEASSEGIGSFRIDTNHDNREMLRLLERCSFERCGTIIYGNGERIAFEKLI